MSYEVQFTSVEVTKALAARLARLATPGTVIGLDGDLGAGKTSFVKGFATGLGIDEDNVYSPTFTLIHEYGPEGRVFHVDLYRIEELRDLATLGLEDLFEREAVVLIEWGERFPEILPADRTEIRIRVGDNDEREVSVTRVEALSGR